MTMTRPNFFSFIFFLLLMNGNNKCPQYRINLVSPFRFDITGAECMAIYKTLRITHFISLTLLTSGQGAYIHYLRPWGPSLEPPHSKRVNTSNTLLKTLYVTILSFTSLTYGQDACIYPLGPLALAPTLDWVGKKFRDLKQKSVFY